MLAACSRNEAPLSELSCPFPHPLISGSGFTPSLPHPSANSAPTKLGRKRKIDDSRCRKHRPPSPHLTPPASPTELSRLSALCLRSPSISLNGNSRPLYLVGVPSQVQSSSYLLHFALPTSGRKIPPLAGLRHQGSSSSLCALVLNDLQGASSINICLSFPQATGRGGGGLARPLPHVKIHTHPSPTKVSQKLVLDFTLFCFGVEKISLRGSSRKGAGGAGLQGREGGRQRAGARVIA